MLYWAAGIHFESAVNISDSINTHTHTHRRAQSSRTKEETHTQVRKHTCMHALCANIHKAHTRIQYICVNECWPGVPLGGNYSARRGSILTASCFLSLSLWPLAPSLKNMTALLPYSACVCLCSHVSLHVCVLPIAFDSFIPCLFNSQPTKSIDVYVSAGV